MAVSAALVLSILSFGLVSHGVSGDLCATLQGALKNVPDLSYHVEPKDVTCRDMNKCLKIQSCKRRSELDIFCLEAEQFMLSKIWRSGRVIINSSLTPAESEGLSLYYGGSPEEVLKQRLSQPDRWLLSLLTSSSSMSRFEELGVDLFNNSCVAVSSNAGYELVFKRRFIDLWYVASLVLGLALVWSAPQLCRNVVLQYTTGVSVGVVGSLVILVFILSRCMPRKSLAATFLVTGWSATVALFGYLRRHLQTYLLEHKEYIAGYVGVAALLSFAYVYYKGPLTNSRGLNLIQWCLQAVGLVFVYLSTSRLEVSAALVIITVTVYNIPMSCFSWGARQWRLAVAEEEDEREEDIVEYEDVLETQVEVEEEPRGEPGPGGDAAHEEAVAAGTAVPPEDPNGSVGGEGIGVCPAMRRQPQPEYDSDDSMTWDDIQNDFSSPRAATVADYLPSGAGLPASGDTRNDLQTKLSREISRARQVERYAKQRRRVLQEALAIISDDEGDASS